MRGWVRIVVLSAALSVVACGSDGNGNHESNNAANNGGNNQTGITRVANIGFPFTHVAALEDGLAVAGFGDGVVKVARLNSAFEPVWAVDLAGVSVPTAVDVDAQGRIVLLSHQGLGPGYIVRLSADGTLDRALTAASGYFTEMVMLEDGGIMLNDGVRLDADLQIVSRGTAGGQSVAKTSDGYVFLSARDLGLGGRSSGAMVRKADSDANLVWQSFSSPNPANYSPIGIRELPDGAILAAVSGDTNPGFTLVIAMFEADGTHRATLRPGFSRPDGDGYQVPLQFGSGIDLLADGATTYASFVANSGGLGSDLRTRITAKIGADGLPTGALFQGGGLAKIGNSLVVAHESGSLISTNTMTSECIGSPSIGGGEIESQTEFKSADEVAGTAQTYDLIEHEVTVTPATLTLSAECG